MSLCPYHGDQLMPHVCGVCRTIQISNQQRRAIAEHAKKVEEDLKKNLHDRKPE